MHHDPQQQPGFDSALITPFKELGGEFPEGYASFAGRLARVRALVFDWDGVFNNGHKTHLDGSGFTEADSMGVNMLRFAIWLQNKGEMPITAIVSGADNKTAKQFATREHFNMVMTGVKRKDEALSVLSRDHAVVPEETAFFFDDIIDFTLAQRCGLRLFFNQPAAPLTRRYVLEHRLADYITGSTGGNMALREVCELLIASLKQFDTVVAARIRFEGKYEQYIQERNRVKTIV